MSVKLYKAGVSDKIGISIEEFDALEGKHEFSDTYLEKKNALLTGVRKREENKLKRRALQIAAAFAIMIVLVPVSTYAAQKYELLDLVGNIFGNSTKGNAVKIDMQIEGNKDLVDVTLPSMEYVPVEEEVAKKYLPEELSGLPIEADLGDGHKITIYDFVYNKYGGAMYYTIERQGGITMLFYDEYTNQSKGFGINSNAKCSYQIGAGEYNFPGLKQYVNSGKSTDEKLDCYAYFVFSRPLEEGEVLTFEVEACGNYYSQYKDLNKVIPLSEDLKMSDAEETYIATETYVENQEATLTVTPINMDIDLLNGFGYTEDSPSLDGYLIRRIEINYKDGSSYVVEDKDKNIDNTGYVGAGLGQNIKKEDRIMGSHYGIAFNRIIDLEAIDSIMVNNMKFLYDSTN